MPKLRKELANDYRAMLQEFGFSDKESLSVLRFKAAQDREPGRIEFKAQEDGESADLYLYGEIGFDFWGDGSATSAKDFQQQLVALGDISEIRLFVNSPGGDVFDGMVIYNLLARHDAQVNVEIQGWAASAASYVVQAGDSIKIAENAMMMIHDAWGITVGNSQDMLDMAAVLEKLDGQIAGIYAARSGRKASTFRTLMDAETWFTAQEAVDNKLATEVVKNKKAAAMAFDLSMYRNAPQIEDVAEEEEEIEVPPVKVASQLEIAARLRCLELDGDAA